jgi:hypothetical protein
MIYGYRRFSGDPWRMTEEDAKASLWRCLMLKWETACRAYQTAHAAEASLAGGDDTAAEHRALAEQALAELRSVKQQIDALIAEASQRHARRDGTLVIATIEKSVTLTTRGDRRNRQ